MSSKCFIFLAFPKPTIMSAVHQYDRKFLESLASPLYLHSTSSPQQKSHQYYHVI